MPPLPVVPVPESSKSTREPPLKVVLALACPRLWDEKMQSQGAEQKFYHLDLPEAPAANAIAAVRNAYTRRCNEQQEVACLMLASMIPELQKNLENLAAFDMLRELKVMFEQQAEHELFDMVKSFHACKQEEGQSVSIYVMKMKDYLDQMDRLGYPMPQILGVSLILTSLSKDYDQFVQIYNMHSMGKTIAQLHNMLKLAEKGMPKKAPLVLAINQGRIQKKNKGKPQAPGKGQGNGKAKLAYAPKPKIPPPAKKEHPTKDTVCHHCGVVGHWRRNCAAYLEGLRKNKASGASTSGIFTIELLDKQFVWAIWFHKATLALPFYVFIGSVWSPVMAFVMTVWWFLDGMGYVILLICGMGHDFC
ncbi:zinc finger, CCHC-type [Artemisia annua]|uniref:Zinc finger, CCHC-type n=1 Tax=Artemisia annua TaxID=35608 RepID=A0A2U1QE85_ARTAN|nr:zinc finger, CCHC-type [Artemisia annua]